jgi:hypothetical protein
MILKNADSKQPQIDELNRLLGIAPAEIKPKIEAEIKMLHAGAKGERESSFYINEKFKDSKNAVVIHDLRLEHNGQAAQIDHVILNRMFGAFVLETKHFHAGLKINENGEFEQWVPRMKSYVGMASPLEQNARHIDVLKRVFTDKIETPKRLGFQFQPTFYSRILVNPTAKISRPKYFDTNDVIKADAFFTKYNQDYDKAGFFEAIGQVAKIVSTETVVEICNQLIALHQPLTINYTAKFGIKEEFLSPQKSIDKAAEKTKIIEQPLAIYNTHQCSKCSSKNLKVEYGKYGYYFKCADCEGNTAIKLDCDVKGHKVKIRKKGNQFYSDCAECASSKLFFENH